MLWNRCLRPVLFLGDAERTHYRAMAALQAAAWIPAFRWGLRRWTSVADPRLEMSVLGLRFSNPMGLAAGFDKDARWHHLLADLGFGSIEVGTITDQPQPGNPLPRLFRLPADQALLNRLGFNNAGAAVARQRLQQRPSSVVLGINLGKSKVTPNEQAVDSYLSSLRQLWEFADYVAVNVSSPNTPGLRELQDREPLLALLAALQQENQRLAAQQSGRPKPILVKIAPDLNDQQVEDVVEIALTAGLAGVIATNTTIQRQGLRTDPQRLRALGEGGISGRPVHDRACQVVRRVYCRGEGRLAIIGVGGVFDGDDAWRMIGAGASLVQLYTGLIYGGPLMVARINRRLLQRVEEMGLGHLQDWVGQQAKR